MDVDNPDLPDNDLASHTDTPLADPHIPETAAASAFPRTNVENRTLPATSHGSSSERAGGPQEDNLTLQPYETPRDGNRGRGARGRGKQSGRRRRPSVNWRDTIFPDDSKTANFKKFFIVKARNTDNLSRIDVIRANKDIETRLGGKPAKITETRSGTLILEVRNEQQSRAAPLIVSLADIPVIVEEHARLNESKGTIWYANSFGYDDEQLLEELTQFGVKAVYRTKRKQNNVLLPSPIYILTFDACVLPEKVSIGWSQCSVRSYIPRPRRCFKCQAFGHGANTCRKEIAICFNCAEETHELPCNRPANCPNCEEAHPATYISCVAYKMEAEILATQVKERITYGEAKKQVRDRFVKPQTSFAVTAQRPRDVAPRSAPIRGTGNATTAGRIGNMASNRPTNQPLEIATQTEDSEIDAAAQISFPRPQRKQTSTITRQNSGCKRQPNATVIPIQSRKRPPSPTIETSTKKPALPALQREYPVRRPSVSDETRHATEEVHPPDQRSINPPQRGPQPSTSSTITGSTGKPEVPTRPANQRDSTRRPSLSDSKHPPTGEPRPTERRQQGGSNDASKREADLQQLLRDYPVPPNAPDIAPPPPLVQTRPWDQTERSHASNKPIAVIVSKQTDNSKPSNYHDKQWR